MVFFLISLLGLRDVGVDLGASFRIGTKVKSRCDPAKSRLLMFRLAMPGTARPQRQTAIQITTAYYADSPAFSSDSEAIGRVSAHRRAMKAFEHKWCSASFQKLMCPESIMTPRFVGSPPVIV